MPAFQMGNPDLRPDEDCIHVPTSYVIERELRDWEGNALVTWALRVPPSTTAHNIEDAIVSEFRLRQDDITVTRHRPEAFLIRFRHRRHFEDVTTHHQGQVQVQWRRGVRAVMPQPHRRPWSRTLLPLHAWQPDIVERLVGRTCALQCIHTNLFAGRHACTLRSPRDTRRSNSPRDPTGWTVNEIPFTPLSAERRCPSSRPPPRRQLERAATSHAEDALASNGALQGVRALPLSIARAAAGAQIAATRIGRTAPRPRAPGSEADSYGLSLLGVASGKAPAVVWVEHWSFCKAPDSLAVASWPLIEFCVKKTNAKLVTDTVS
ncbi:unnamed protein product [Urochloa humidicola]